MNREEQHFVFYKQIIRNVEWSQKSRVEKKKKLSRHFRELGSNMIAYTIPLTSSSNMHVLKTLILLALALLMEPNTMARRLVVQALPVREEWPQRVKISSGANALLSAAG